MNSNQKQEIQAQFLEEAQDYLNTIESGLLGMASSGVNHETVDSILRAAHSIKGGAAMMGFQLLSDLAHRLEDFFKIIKTGRVSLDQVLERLFLASVDCLRQIVRNYSQGATVDSNGLDQKFQPIFESLHELLGDLQPEDEEMLLAINNQTNEQDMSVFLFESQVEDCLTELEEIAENGDFATLKEELEQVTQELSGLGEMLELPAFSQLCHSIEQNLQENPEQVEVIAQSAIQQLRRSQALILTQQKHLLPHELKLDTAPSPAMNPDELPDSSSLEAIDDFLPEDVLDVFSSLELSVDSEPLVQETLQKIPVTESIEEAQIEEETAEYSSESPENTIRVSVSQLEDLGDLFGELTIERNGLDLQLQSLRHLFNYLRQKVRNLEKVNFQLRTLYDQNTVPSFQSPELVNSTNSILSASPSFDLLEMDRYSNLHLVSGEMMENIVQIQEVTNDLEIHLAETEKINRELTRTSKLMQTNLTQVRMRPISDLLKRFPRALRDMELQYGKQVELKIKGGTTLLEKSILEALNDPLLHLMRNAFDHGIETPEIRRKLGKPETGTIEISAAYRGNQTFITIRDDGKGIDLEKLRDKAKQMGLDEEDLSQVSEKELLDLIFEPGFSTSEQVTDLSGRGVGMDVVRRNIEQIRGEIFVDTKQGIGTTFTLSVPFTLSVVRVLLVETQKMLLAFPSNAVEEVCLLDPEIIIQSAGQEFLKWEDSMVRLVRLGKWLKFAHSTPNLETEAIPVINKPTLLMIEQENHVVGLEVDRYWGEQEVTIRQVEGNLNLPPGFTGCTILGDGRVVPLIDALELLNWIDEQSSQTVSSSHLNESLISSVAQEPEITSSTKHRIMVVDDSINVRRFLALTLEKANYQVEQAKDGQDALEKLQEGIPVEVIVCDIEMPRLDGYGFLAHVKSDPDFKHIPVMMLTSRSGEKHRKMAMNLGATAYFSKPFQEKELLSTLKELVKKSELIYQ